MNLIAWTTSIMMMAVWLWPIPSTAQEISVPGQTSLAEIEEIELVYTGNQSAPKIIVRGRQPANPFVVSSYRPPDLRLDLFSLTSAGTSIGLCQAQQDGFKAPFRIRLVGNGTSPCGFAWSLQTTNKRFDALSFHRLRVRGTSSNPLAIVLVAKSADREQDSAVVGHVTGRFEVEFPLAPSAHTLDLRQLTQVQLLAENDADVLLDEIVWLTREPTIHPTRSIGFWYWDYRSAIRNPAEMLSTCRQHHCRRLMLQMPDLKDSDQVWAAYAALFASTRAAGIELFALDEAPDMIDTPIILSEKLTRLLKLVGTSGLPGVQLDIEPYLLDGFPDDGTIFDRYLSTIERVKAAFGDRGRLSVVIPFWFTSTVHRSRPLAFAVMDRADEVAVMSYRTDVHELTAISEDTLRYGFLTGIPVWLGMETTRLLPERHVILKREMNPTLADGMLDPVRRIFALGNAAPADLRGQGQLWFRIHHHTTVRPERLSFADRTRREVRLAINQVFARIPTPSLSGLLIHDLPGYLGLQE